MKTSELVKTYRLKLGMSQPSLSDKSGIPQSTISAIEKGTEPKWETLKPLARVLNITVEDLMGTTEEVKN